MKIHEIAKCLSCESKVMILQQLLVKKVCVNELCETLSLKQANTSKHLAELREKGVILCEIEGQQRCYTINPKMETKIREIFNLLG